MAGRAAGRRGGVRGLRHRLRTRAADVVDEPERRRHRRHFADRRGLHRRVGRGRPAGQAAAGARGHRLHRRRGAAGHRRWPVGGGAVRGVRVPGRARRIDLGAGRGHRPDRRAGRRRGAAADDAAATGPSGRTSDRPTPAAPWPTSTRPTTWARWSAGWPGRLSCCRSWA